jgi:peptide-methionine (S)-S-oxide reductase
LVIRTEVLTLVVTGAPLLFGAARLPAQAAAPRSAPRRQAEATFAGGCFWCMEHPFDQLTGVISVTSGYAGGHTKNPTYAEVSAGGTGHAESVRVVYDPDQVSYERLLDVFWHNVDPLTSDAQFCDHGSQYRSIIFYHDSAQQRLAEQSKHELEASGRFHQPIVTEVTAAGEFYPAEDYHQHYYRKNPIRYRFYRWSCGRDRRLKELWGASAPPAEAQP